MKKFSTPTLGKPESENESRPNLSPKAWTIAFLRQFARAYCPAPAASMPGIVLN